MILLLLGLALADPSGSDASGPDSRPAAAMHEPGPVRGGVVVLGTPVVTGRLAVEAVEEVLRDYASQLRYCYERERVRTPGLAGTLSARFVVGRDGATSEVTLLDSTLGSPEAEACLVGRFERMRFDPPKRRGEATVVVPLTFTPP